MTTGRRESQLAALVDARRENIVQRFLERARAAGASKALPDEEIVDSLREYLTELAAQLRRDWADDPEVGSGTTAAWAHGEQRFHSGYDLAALIREYGALRELLCDVIVEQGDVPFAEVRILFKYLVRGVAEAAARYSAVRDAELRKRSSEHLAFLAHELRNPLSTALAAAALVRARGDVKPSRAFDSLERAIMKTAQLVDDALVNVRLRELGRMDCSNVDLGELLRELAADSEEDAAAKNIRIHVEGSAEIVADRKALHSAISNLIRNAVKFSRPRGEIQISVRVADARVFVEVADACGGLPDGMINKLFDPFVQAGADRSGFGLGLAIAKQAAEAHTGQLRVHNLPGKGCVFVLDMPIKPASKDNADTSADPKKSGSRRGGSR